MDGAMRQVLWWLVVFPHLLAFCGFSVKWGFGFYLVAVSSFVWGLRETQSYPATTAIFPECHLRVWGLCATSFKPLTLFPDLNEWWSGLPHSPVQKDELLPLYPSWGHHINTIQLEVVLFYRNTSDITNRYSFLGRVVSIEPGGKKEWEWRAIWELMLSILQRSEDRTSADDVTAGAHVCSRFISPHLPLLQFGAINVMSLLH